MPTYRTYRKPDGLASLRPLGEAIKAVLYPPRVSPHGMDGMGGGFQKWLMDSMEWGVDSILLADGFWLMDSILLVDGFHTFA